MQLQISEISERAKQHFKIYAREKILIDPLHIY